MCSAILSASLTTLLLTNFIYAANSATKPNHKANSIMVFAASSLTDSYTQLGQRFEKSNPGIKVRFSFQATSTLATQIKSGAPADVFVSAEPVSGINANGRDYLRNRVVLAVPKNSKITQISDLNGAISWVVCAKEVPCGKVAQAALAGEQITTQPVSYEPRVSSAVAKLLAGEVDAALIYRSDVVTNNQRLRSIEFQNRNATYTTYQIFQLSQSKNVARFVKYLQSESAIRYLQSKGFERI